MVMELETSLPTTCTVMVASPLLIAIQAPVLETILTILVAELDQKELTIGAIIRLDGCRQSTAIADISREILSASDGDASCGNQ